MDRNKQKGNPKKKFAKNKSVHRSTVDNAANTDNSEPSTNNETNKTNDVMSKKEPDGWKNRIIEEVKTVQFWINAFLLLFTGFTYYTASQANDMTKEQFDIQNKPYLNVAMEQ